MVILAGRLQLVWSNRLTPINGKWEVYDKRTILVQISSATEAVPNQVRHNHIPIDGDHKSMIKFSKKTDNSFRQVNAEILSMIHIAQVMLETQSLEPCMSTVSNVLNAVYNSFFINVIN